MYNCNLDEAVKHVKTIVENNRCVFCDQLNESFVRYPCGHSTCSNCIETTEDCLICLTPPDAPAHFVDEPLTKRVRNASELLIAFQELFQIDVYRRHRVSEKLKLEKQFFPECIQASTKYCNKRKSLTITGKENKRFSSLPGENISSINQISKMENTVNYVEKWLNKNESVQKSYKNLPRKPFTDLNVNQTNNKDANNVGFQTSIKQSHGRKRTHLKIIKSDTSNVPKVSYKRIKNNTNIKKHGIQEMNKKNNRKSENNESGIFIDDEIIDIDDSQREIIDIDDSQREIIDIDDSPNEIVDKDRLALLEVLQADKNNDSVDCGIESSMNENEIIIKDNFNEPNKSGEVFKTYRVPFFKKSTLAHVSNVNINNFKDTNKTTPTSKNITVTIDNDSFVTTIKVSNLSEFASCSGKQSTSAQTDNDISDTAVFPDKIELNKINIPTEVINEDKVMEIKSIESNINKQTSKRKCLIIEESDSDSDLTDDNINSLEVTAEVHQSNTHIGNGVLCELDQNVYEHRGKHSARGHTPLSTDSSDKENYDPNRIKRQKTEKKSCTKK